MRHVLNPKISSDRPDRVRRRLLSLTVMAAGLACFPRRTWAQEADPGSFARTMRFIRNWWERTTREPEEADEEIKDAARFVSPVRPTPRSWSSGGITVTWIGHSTFLINLEGTTILTDPAFSQKVGINLLGLATLGLRRFVPPALRISELPPLDLILVSHAHMDHYDVPSLRKLPRSVPVILARDTIEFMDDVGFSQVQELDWGQTAEVKGVRIEAVPVKHWGRRYPWDRDRGYNGLLLTKHKRSLLFGGDTAYTERLPATTNGQSLDVALLPIGGYNPYIANHASPEQAWDLYHEMRASYLIPMHWRTFRMSRERPFEPYERLATAVNGSASRIALHTIGETWTLPG
jgi:L-ascorbate metabolism protein UlaG (beta-lactamase superfamily)